MATVTFTNAEIDFIFAIGGSSNWSAVAATFTSMEGDSGVVPYDGPAGAIPTTMLAAIGVPHDDGTTVPPVITITNLHIAMDWAVSNVVPVAGDVSWIDADSIGLSTKQAQANGVSSGHHSDDYDPAAYLGGTDRAAMFAGVDWTYSWIDPVAGWASGRVAISNYVVTFTYTVPSAPEVTRINPSSGSVNGDQTVTITGTGLTGAPGATVGGVALTSFTVVSDTSITGVTGEHASGVVDVEVTGVGTLANGYTYFIPPSFRLPPIPTRTPIMQGGRPRRG